MGDNDIDIVKIERKIYTKEVLNSLRSSELSNLWPKSLDKGCINSYGQWDPVKSFDSSKPSDTKKNSFYESKPYRNNDKNKDDISLRPERRKWNDGCQVSSTKRNSEDIHSYRKSYQSTAPNNGGGDYDRRSFNRNSGRGVKPRENDRDNKYNNIKSDKSSRNNSNLEERKDDKDGQNYGVKNGTNSRSNNIQSNEPEWFSNGPENCDETIELRGITVNDSAIVNFKKNCTREEAKEEPEKGDVKEVEKIVLNFSNEKPVFVDTCITSPKREGSRFQDIFQKETKNNYLKESKDVENIIKAVLSENVSNIDPEKLSNVSKPLPNGVLTVEEIEKGMTSTPVDFKRIPSKSTTLETPPLFEPSQNPFLSGGVSSPSVDNYKVVNWLSNLNIATKEPEIDHKQFFPESQNSVPINNTVPIPSPQQQQQQPQQQMHMPINYSKFAPNLQHPPGLPQMLNPAHMLLQSQQQQQSQQLLQQQQSLRHQQMFQQQQQSLQQQSLKQQPMPQHLSIQQTQAMHQSLQNQKQIAFMKQMSMGPPNNVNIAQRNIMNDGYMPEKYKLTTQQSLPSDSNILSNFLIKNNLQMNHINDRNDMCMMNGPPGLSNMNSVDKSMIMSRPIVKTNPHGLMDFAQLNDLPYQYHNNYHRSISNNLYIQNHEMNNKSAQFNSNLELFKKLQPAMMAGNNYQLSQQQPQAQSAMLPMAFDSAGQRVSSKKMLDNLFNVNSSYLPPLPQAKYADQIETENI